MVGNERVGAPDSLPEVRDTHPGFTLSEGTGARTGGVGEENDDAQPQGISERAEAGQQILSRKCEHVPCFHVAVAPGSHRVRSHQSPWVRVSQATDTLERSF